MVNIRIGNIRNVNEDEGERVDRGTILGNPYRLDFENDREIVIGKYQKWFEENVHNKGFRKELKRLLKLARRPEGLTLLCWCHPKKCHAEIIRNHLIELDKTEPANGDMNGQV